MSNEMQAVIFYAAMIIDIWWRGMNTSLFPMGAYLCYVGLAMGLLSPRLYYFRLYGLNSSAETPMWAKNLSWAGVVLALAPTPAAIAAVYMVRVSYVPGGSALALLSLSLILTMTVCFVLALIIVPVISAIIERSVSFRAFVRASSKNGHW